MIKVYGHSDDCIEVEGDIEDEFNYNYSEDDPTAKFLSFSDGTVIKVTYGLDGADWQLSIFAKNPESSVTHTPPIGNSYTDVVGIDADIKWVVIGDQFVGKR